MTTTSDVQSAAPQHPVGRTPQNDFREQSVSPAAEHATWEHSTSDKTPATSPQRTVDVASDALAPFTVSAIIGADLGAGKGLSPAVRLLADDPSRTRALLTDFRGSVVYIASTPEAFEGFAARVKTDGTNAAPMPGMCAVEGLSTELLTTRQLWVIFGGVPAVNAWVSGYVERAARTRP